MKRSNNRKIDNFPFKPAYTPAVRAEIKKLFKLEAIRSEKRIRDIFALSYDGKLMVAFRDPETGKVFDIKTRNKLFRDDTRGDRTEKWASEAGSTAKALYGFDNPDNPLCFIASGTAEYILLKASGLNYVALPSDSVKIPFDKIRKKKLIPVVISDNDANTPLNDPFLQKILRKNPESPFIYIDWRVLLGSYIKKGYDLRDFANTFPKDWEARLTIAACYQMSTLGGYVAGRGAISRVGYGLTMEKKRKLYRSVVNIQS